MIKRIYHISDIHNRLYTRHDEYREIFSIMFEKIKELGIADSLIILTGDIVHAKTDISPEQMLLTTELLLGCINLCPTILIPGNHDYNESNKSKLDALYPVVKAINSNKLHYSKHSEVLEIDGVTISHLSIFDGKSTWKLADDIQGHKKIALYHGPVAGSQTSIGFSNFTNALPISVFDGFDMVMLGDIHLYQTFGDKNNIAYASSLIQQDHGETVQGHGFIMWDIETCTHKFIEIPNPYAHYTIEIVDGNVVGDIPVLNSKSNVRLMLNRTDPKTIKDITDGIITKYGVSNIQIREDRDVQWRPSASTAAVDNIFKSWDIDAQTQLFVEYFDSVNIKLTDDVLNQIIAVHRDMSVKYTNDDTVYGLTWTPLKFEFSNMFSYGEDVVIDFENMSGIVGLFAPNRSGKSNLLDSMLFTLFDKCTRTSLAGYVLNKDSTEFYGKFRIKLKSDVYEIVRTGKRGATGKVSVKVEFTKYAEDGEIISLNGKSRDDTNKNIRKYFGTYDDFLTTTLNTQSDPRSIIDMTQVDRKEMMCKYIDIDRYGLMSNSAKDIYKDKMAEVKLLANRNYEQDLFDYAIKKGALEVNIDETNVKILDCQTNIENITREIEAIQIDNNIENIDIDAVNKNINNCNLNIIEYTKNKSVGIENEAVYQVELDRLTNMLNQIDYTLIELDLKKCNDESELFNTLSTDLKAINTKIENIELVSKQLHEHKYNPNCEFCVSNTFVANAIALKQELPNVILDRDRIMARIAAINHADIVQKKNSLVELIGNYNIMVNDHKNYTVKLEAVKNLLINSDSLISSERDKLLLYHQKVEQYNANLDKLQLNIINKEKISKLSETRTELNKKLSDLSKELASFEVSLRILISDVLKCEMDKQKLADAQRDAAVYEYYSMATSRNGVPFMILKNIIPIIESEVNAILDMSVNFKLQLEMVDLDINGYIIGGQNGDERWPFELASGMEKFIISTAIRSSLVRISGLPKPNFLLVDEGFGVLDSDNLRGIINVLNFLKQKFGFILCVSHITELRDYMDMILNVSKIDNRSVISQEFGINNI